MKEIKVACLGDCNIDMSIPIACLPQKGGSVHSGYLHRGIGGTMLNVAVVLSEFGITPFPLTFLGDDRDGDEIEHYLWTKMIPQKGIVKSSQYMTGNTIALVVPDGEKYWIAIRNTAADRHIKMVPSIYKTCDECEALFISGTAISEGIESSETALNLAKRCRANGQTVFLDPNLRVLGNSLAAEEKEKFNQIFPYIDVLIPNEAEAKMLGECDDAVKAAQEILNHGVKNIWVKCGGNGSFFLSKEEYKHFPANKVEVVDTTGAGDSYSASIIYCYLSGKSIMQTGLFANAYASYTTTSYGSTEAFGGKEVIENLENMVFCAQ